MVSANSHIPRTILECFARALCATRHRGADRELSAGALDRPLHGWGLRLLLDVPSASLVRPAPSGQTVPNTSNRLRDTTNPPTPPAKEVARSRPLQSG